jgi:hypothetical protein
MFSWRFGGDIDPALAELDCVSKSFGRIWLPELSACKQLGQRYCLIA